MNQTYSRIRQREDGIVCGLDGEGESCWDLEIESEASRISVGEDKGRGNEDDLFAYKSAG
jgi:hypothetical protein